jgi:excisionase family DNA binding protein
MDPVLNVSPAYLTTVEAAIHLRCSRQYLEIARHKGEGPPYCKLGRVVRYHKPALDEWMKRTERAGATTVSLPAKHA